VPAEHPVLEPIGVALSHLPDLAGQRAFHIVGAGGGNMNTIASVLISMGHRVSGSDLRPSPVLERLERQGALIYIGHSPSNVGDVDGVAFSAAVRAGNVEIVEASRRGIPVYSRTEILSAICGYREVLAVSGTHGKTTTTAMLAAILARSGLRPSYMVGGELPGGRGTAKWDNGRFLVVEADESDGTFLHLGAFGAVVTSLEADHLDHFGDLAALRRAFGVFVDAAQGPRVVCLDDPGAAQLVRQAERAEDLWTYGAGEGAGYQVHDLALSATGADFEVRGPGGELGAFRLAVPGLHNVLDATAALAMALQVGAAPEDARSALASFQSVRRRFETKGRRDGITYIDDYAHNPGKLRAAMATARLGHWARVVAVFQPHRYSRTAALSPELGEALAAADVLVVTDIYSAGEAPLEGVSGRLVAEAAKDAQPAMQVEYLEGRQALVGRLRELLRPGDLCLSLGAGDITTLADDLLGRSSGQ